MIVHCTACDARIRLDSERYAGKRLTLRCPRCRKSFSASVPRSELRTLVAHGDAQLCRTIEDILQGGGISTVTCNDGNQVLVAAREFKPQVVLVDVALPGIFVFELVDRLRQDPEIAEIKIILLSSVYNKTAYKRTPSALYGADDYIEKHHLPDALVSMVKRLAAVKVDATGARPGWGEGPAHGNVTPEMQKINDRIQQAEQEDIVEGGHVEIEKARRLARMIVTDIALYHQDRVEQGIREGNLIEELRQEVAEGRRLLEERLGSEVAGQKDFVREAFDHFVARRRREWQV